MAADARLIDMSDLKDLDPLSKRLNAASNELNSSLQTIQDRLNALGIGLEVWLPQALAESEAREVPGPAVHDDADLFWDKVHDTQELGYGRLGDGWALLVRTRRHVERFRTAAGDSEEYNTYVDDSPRPLLKAARDLRVAAVPLIPDLLTAIEQQAQTIIERVEQAKKIADSLK